MARDKTLESVFSQLKIYCVDLLDFLRNPKKNASFLPAMAKFLRRAPPEGLQPCLDYTLFPLLLLLDKAVECRSGEKSASVGTGDSPVRVSDSVSEGVLMCLEEILKKCHLGSVNQLVVVLKKLTSGALLSPSEAAEEFREGIIRCLRAMLLRLQPCSMDSCSCKQISLSHTITIATLQTEHITPSMYGAKPQECLLAFLQSQDASAAVGHWLSLLLQTAEFEAERGLSGSANLRKEAFLTLRVFVAKVGTADALAYFLPGIVSRFTKALYVSKSMISGAAGSTGSMEHAVRGLTEFLIIVLNDEANLYGLDMSKDDITGFHEKKSRSTQSVLEALRHLPANVQNYSNSSAGNPSSQSLMLISSGDELKEKSYDNRYAIRSLHVHRTKEWIDETSAHVDRLLSTTFPHLCVHPAVRVREGISDGIRGILTSCSYTLKRSKRMLLECLCVLVCDDSETVSAIAQESLDSLFMFGKKILEENEISEMFMSLIERLPRVVLGSDETVAVSHARRLFALLYYAGPELVAHHLLLSPVKTTHFLNNLGLTLSHNSRYAGAMHKLISSKPLPVGYLLSIAELKAGTLVSGAGHVMDSAASPAVSRISVVQDEDVQNSVKNITGDFEFPRMPPWFTHVGSKELYLALAGILRLASLSTMAGHKSDVSLSVPIDILLDHFHKLISELRMREYSKEGWKSWYSQRGSGQLLRQTSVAACMLNEIIYGLSDQSISSYSKIFRNTGEKDEEAQGKIFSSEDNKLSGCRCIGSAWMARQDKDARDHVIHCVGSILHEYLSPEVWDLLVDQNSPLLEHDDGDLPLHFLCDTTMLHQVIIDGIGVFSLKLGKDFLCSGFMHSSLYLLLRNLICSNSLIRSASDAVLRVLSATSGYATVGHLVLANADYVIDSLCRELRHLDLNPHVADVLAAILSYIGAAREILPLLEEPMRAISMELEVLGRYQNPHLTIPFLQAVSEISKASRCEALRLPNEANQFYGHTDSMALSLRNWGENEHTERVVQHMGSETSEMESVNHNDVDQQLDHWEEFLSQLNDMKRYRRIVGSLVGSCLKAATPLLSSSKEAACLLALDIVEDAIISLAKVEEAYKHEKETSLSIVRAIQSCSFDDPQETMDTADEEPDENRLLPAINKIWPFLVLCLKNRISVAAIRRCTVVVSKAVEISGGDFFVRRFHQDGSVIWKLLTMSPLRRRSMSLKDDRPILLPYRNIPSSSEDPMAEISSTKIQAAVLKMIAEICLCKRSAPAVEVVLKKVSGLVVAIACSSITALRDSSIKALSGLACVDPDLIWLLLADVYFSLKRKNGTVTLPLPPRLDLAGVSELLPPPPTPKEYLFVQYGGENFGLDVDPSSVEFVFQKMQAQVFT